MSLLDALKQAEENKDPDSPDKSKVDDPLLSIDTYVVENDDTDELVALDLPDEQELLESQLLILDEPQDPIEEEKPLETIELSLHNENKEENQNRHEAAVKEISITETEVSSSQAEVIEEEEAVSDFTQDQAPSETQTEQPVIHAETDYFESEKSNTKLYVGLVLLLISLSAIAWYFYQLAFPQPHIVPNPTIDIADPLISDSNLEPVAEVNAISAEQTTDSKETVEAETADKAVSNSVAIQDSLPDKASVQDQNQDSEQASDETFEFEYPDNIQIRLSRKNNRTMAVLKQAYQAYQNEAYFQAATYYQTVLKQQPGNIDALLGLASIAEKQDNRPSAKKYYETILSLDANHVYAKLGLTRVLQNSDQTSKISFYQNILEQNPNQLSSYLALARYYSRNNQWQKAQEIYFNIIERFPQHPDHLFNLAISLDQLGKKQIALNYYQQALDLSQKQPANFERSVLETRIQQLQEP